MVSFLSDATMQWSSRSKQRPFPPTVRIHLARQSRHSEHYIDVSMPEYEIELQALKTVFTPSCESHDTSVKLRRLSPTVRDCSLQLISDEASFGR